MTRAIWTSIIGLLILAVSSCSFPEQYELVVKGGRVMNPESGLDAVRNIGISNGRIAAISDDWMRGDREIDASGLIVSPGFIVLVVDEGTLVADAKPGRAIKVH